MGMLYYASTPVVPTTPPVEERIAYNFERFDGLNQLDNNEGAVPEGTNYIGESPRPGARNTPVDQQTYTRGPISGTVGTLGGMPLPVANWLYRTGRGYTPSVTPSVQHRLGVGQDFGGAGQTTQLAQITNNPPVPADMSAIIAGWA